MPYAFNGVTGYTITVGGSGDVSSGSPTASATYSPNGATLTVTFTQSGLPSRTFWRVVVTDPTQGTVSQSTGAASTTLAGLTLGDSYSAYATGFTSCGGTVSGSPVSVTFYLGYHSCDPPQHASGASPGGAVGSGAVFGLLFDTLAALVAATGAGLVVLRMRTPLTKGPAPPVP